MAVLEALVRFGIPAEVIMTKLASRVIGLYC